MKPKIVFIHSLNNFTGSPNVLSIVIHGLLKQGYQAEIITSHGDGFLSSIPNVKYKYTCYCWGGNKIKTSVLLILSQFGLFFRILFYSQKHIYYINTIVPFGAILACRLTGKRFLIHVHENMQQRKPIYKIFRIVYQWCNKKSIFVSNYLYDTALNCREGIVVYNSVSETFFQTAALFFSEKKVHRETILMVASQRRFKGIYEFVELSQRMPQYQFELVLNSDASEVKEFIKEIGHIRNLAVYPLQKNLHPFYQRAKLLLQLSHPETWVETFGLTILEAMVYGVPSIVPNIGGPVELVEDGITGFTLNPHEIPSIQDRIELLMTNNDMYCMFSEKAWIKSQKFKETVMIKRIEKYIL